MNLPFTSQNESSNPSRPDARPHSQFLLLTLGFSLIFLAILAPGIYSVDGNAMLDVSESLVTHRGFTVPEGLGTPGVGGRIYSHWYPLISVLNAPFAYLALLASRVMHQPFHYLAAIFALPMMGVLTAVTAGLVALLAKRLGATARGAWLAAVSFCLGTAALAYGRTFYAEPLLACTVIAAVYFTFELTLRGILLGSAFAALAMLAKPTGIIAGPILVAYLLCKRIPFFRSLLPITGTAIGFALFAAFNVIRFGHPLEFGISNPFTPAYLLQGATGLLLGPGYGLLWYCPPAILAVFGFKRSLLEHKFEALAMAAIFAGFLVLHSCLPYWFAWWSWGPRYLVPVVPLLCAFTGLLQGTLRKALAALALLGFLINAPTMFCFYERYYSELNERGIPTGNNLSWSLEYAPSRTISESRALRVVALWWWVLPIVHIPRVIGAGLSLAMTLCGAWVIFRARFPEESAEPLRSVHPPAPPSE